MIGEILCKTGIHKWRFSEKWLPSLYAKTITEYVFHVECERCNKVKSNIHEKWNGVEFIACPDNFFEE